MRRVLIVLGLAVFALLAIGFVVLASAGVENSLRHHGCRYHFLVQQAKFLLVAIGAGAAAALFDYRKWREHPWLLFSLYAAVALLLVALVPQIAVKIPSNPLVRIDAINGSFRWIAIKGLAAIQPSEFAKIVTVLVIGVWMDRAGWKIWLFWKGVFPMAILVAVFMGLILAEPDLGSAAVVLLASAVMFLVGGVKWLHLGILGMIGALGVVGVFVKTPNRLVRFAAWLSPEWQMKFVELMHLPPDAIAEKGDGADYQLNASLVAFGNAVRSGACPPWDPTTPHLWWNALTGVGYNESLQKRLYLPEAHTDFIFSIGAEEMGLIFSLVVLALFVTFFVCGMLISARAEDRLGRLFAYGATILIFAQAMANLGVVTGRLPTKGLALPFMSYGGTNLVSALVCVGLLFNVGLKIGLQKDRRKSRMPAVFSKPGDPQNV